jgi:hypothetical protein
MELIALRSSPDELMQFMQRIIKTIRILGVKGSRILVFFFKIQYIFFTIFVEKNFQFFIIFMSFTRPPEPLNPRILNLPL